MKILLCTTTFDQLTHGPAKFAQLAMQINDRFPKHEIRILTEGVAESVPNKIYKLTKTYPRLLMAFWPFLDNFTYSKKVREIFKSFAFDVVIFNNAIMGMRTGKRSEDKFKVIGLINDDDYLSASWKNISFNKNWLINIHRRTLERFACLSADHVFANSNYIKKYISELYKPSSISRLYKSISIDNFEFKKDRNHSFGKRIKILFVKSDYPRGGLKILIEALGKLEHEFELIIIGPKEREKPTIYSYFETKSNIHPNYLGPCSQDIVKSWMRDADIFCVPAHKEGLGLANVEALAVGIPVVSTRIGGIPEVLDHGNNGWLSEKDAPEELAKAINDCINSPEKRKTKSAAGRLFVERNFSHINMLNNLIETLEKLTNS